MKKLAQKLSSDQLRRLAPLVWVSIATGLLCVDYLSGPFIRFPILFLVPVYIASWWNGWVCGVLLSVLISAAQFYLNSLTPVPWPESESVINLLIKIVEFTIFALLIDRLSAQTKEVKILRGLLPICSYCKKIRNEGNQWEQLEKYLAEKSEAQFSHGICPDCAREQFPDLTQQKQTQLR